MAHARRSPNSKLASDNSAGSAGAPAGAVEFWDHDLDPANLGRAAVESATTLEREIAFAMTPDVAASRDALRAAPAQAGRARPLLVDLGAGLGSITIAFARAGFDVIAVDTSPQRLRALMARAERAGVADRVKGVVGAAEALPFADGSAPAIFTRSVLIHTDLRRACGEIRRALAPGGRTSLVEPQPGNPFAWVYRRTLAPKEWSGITRYFDRAAIREAVAALEGEGGESGSAENGRASIGRALAGGGARGKPRATVEPFYFFSFLAFAFQFALPHPELLFLALRLTHAADDLIFRAIPQARAAAWFARIGYERES